MVDLKELQKRVYENNLIASTSTKHVKIRYELVMKI